MDYNARNAADRLYPQKVQKLQLSIELGQTKCRRFQLDAN